MGAETLVAELIGMLRGTRVDTLIARIDRGNLVPIPEVSESIQTNHCD